MSNPVNFRGLEGLALKRALGPFISSHLPVLNEALRRGIGTWTIDKNRFTFRYSPRSSRLDTLLSLYKQEQGGLRSYKEITLLLEEQRSAMERGEQVQLITLTENETLLAILYEAEALRAKLIGQKKPNSLSSRDANWEDDSSEEQEEEEVPAADGLSIYLQDWYTFSKKGKKVSQEGLEVVIQAHEADDKEAPAEDGAGWNT